MTLSSLRSLLMIALCSVMFELLGCGPAEESVPAPTRRDFLTTEKNLYSQHNEELVIRDFFQDRKGGIFLDVGCAWPVIYNNTYYLEHHLDWTGIGVDALEDYAFRWGRRRPKSKFFNYIVTDHSGRVESFYRTERGDLIGISTLTPGPGPEGKIEYQEIQVPTITLNDLLDQNGITRLDLLSMDIEGAEPLALAGFDVERFKPRLVCIEVKAATRGPILEYFEQHGYETIERYNEFDFANLYFTPRSGER